MTLSEAFKEAVEVNPISPLELSWSMGVSAERLKELVEGANYIPSEELEMFRFVFKHRKKEDSGQRDSFPKLDIGFSIQE